MTAVRHPECTHPAKLPPGISCSCSRCVSYALLQRRSKSAICARVKAHTREALLSMVAAGVLSGCSAPVPLSVRDGVTVGHDMETLPEVVEDACGLLGIACEASEWEYGAVQLDLIVVDADREREHMGHALVVHGRTDDSPCTPKVWADPTDVTYVAHELGHVFGLEHNHVDHNLMNSDGRPDTDITDEQIDRVVQHADWFVNCR